MLPLTGHTRVPADKVFLERARPVEGMAEVLAEGLKHKNKPLGPFPMDLPLTSLTRVPAGYGGAAVGQGRGGDGEGPR